MDYFPVILLFFALLVSITRTFTVLFHELGHAIPAILMSKKAVTIYIGSYGDPKKSWHFKLGLLEVWFKYNPFLWRLGLCIPSATQMSINKQIIYILTGPLTSLMMAIVAYYFTLTDDVNSFLRIILIIFIGSSILDLLINLIPNSNPIKLYDGSFAFNDGYRLLELFYYKKFPKEYMVAADLYNQQNYAEAAIKFNSILKSGLKNENIYRLTIASFLQVKNYKQAKEISDEFMIHCSLNSDDFANTAISYSHLNDHDKAIEFYNKSLEINPKNKYSLNNKGFTLNILEKYEEAIPMFDKAIAIDSAFAYSYNNRGLAKIKIGKLEEGLKDINYSLQIDENNAYGYRNLGIYYFDIKEYATALELFTKAKELDNSTYQIDELIYQAGIQIPK